MGPFQINILEDSEADYLALRRAIASIMEEMGGTVSFTHHRTIREAYEALLFRGSKPDLIFVDLRLRDGSGLNFLRQVQDDARVVPCPKIVITSSTSESDLAEAFRNDAAGYMVKPTDTRELRKAIKACLEYWLLASLRPPQILPEVSPLQNSRISPSTIKDFLVVDDSVADRTLVMRSLRKRSSEVTIREAASVEEAIKLIESRRPDCLITDVHLPGSTGIKMLEKMQVRFGRLPCPVVVVTGSGDQSKGVEALRAGAHDYINKARIDEPVLWEAVLYAQTRFLLRKELEELNAELRRKDRIKTEFVANATHELRTPLTAIVGLVSVLKENDKITREKTEEYLETISACCDSLLLSVDDILDLTKMEAGEFVLYPAPFEPIESLTMIATSLRPLIEDKGLELRIETPPELPMVLGDARRLRQLIYNLTSNALKFTREGSVTLRIQVVERRDQEVVLRFEVADTGIGISSEARERVFERHFQSGGKSLRVQGTGLGLAIVDALTRRMGGRVGVESELGVGSTFWFELSLELASKPSDPTEREESERVAEYRPLRVLVAEDNTIIAKVLVKQLQVLGHEPTLVYNGQEAVNEAQIQYFDAAVLDARMPEVDGLSAAREIRRSFSSSQLPLILLTAEALIEREVWQDAGFNACLIKPVAPDALGRLLTSLTHRP